MQHPHDTSSLPLLLFHGLLSSPKEFGLIAQNLKARGLDFTSPEMPGYTLDAGDVSLNWQRWREAAHDAIDARVAPDAPVVLGGLCMGGVLAAAAALQRQRQVAGLVLISPTFTYDGWGLPAICRFRRMAYWTRLDRYITFSEREPYGVKNAKIRNWVMRDFEQRTLSAVGPARMSLRALREGERLMDEVRRNLATLDCPILVIHAREDEITSLASVQRLFDALPARDKELAVLENSYHMVTIDNDRHEVAALLERFTKRVTAAQDVPQPLMPAAEPANDMAMRPHLSPALLAR